MSQTNGNGRVEPGQPIAQAFSARAWNRAQDAADIVLSQGSVFAAQSQPQSGAPYTFVYMRNTADRPVERWQAIAIDGLEGAPLEGSAAASARSQFGSMPVLRGVKPAQNKRHAIAIEPIAPNAIGRVAVAGVVQARITATNESSQYFRAKVNPGDFGALDASETGEFAIVWRDEGEGFRWGLVRFDADTAGSSRLCKTTAAWEKGTLADLPVWESGNIISETETEGVQIINAANKFANIGADKFVMLSRAGNGYWYVVAAEC